MYIKFALIIVFIFWVSIAFPQPYSRCSTVEHHDFLIKKGYIPANYFSQLDKTIEQWTQNKVQKIEGSIITIPVVFHVVYNTSLQNIPDARIIAQLDVINRDYSRNNADTINTPAIFKPVAANAEIQFCLATKDPEGNPTSGITRTFTTSSGFTFTTNDMKFTSSGGIDIWDNKKYLNIWIVNFTDQTLGFAQFPGTGPNFPANTDGVVLDYRAVGGPMAQGIAIPYHLGRTATHEIGHWLGLYHPFQGGCTGLNPVNCGSAGDQVCDTPAEGSPTFGCPVNQNTCVDTPNDLPDMVTNFMDYTDDPCMNIFTKGQAERMHGVLNVFRNTFLLPGDCQFTAIKPTKDSIHIFPNPSNGDMRLNITFTEETDLSIYLFNAWGKQILQIEAPNILIDNITLNMEKLSSGIYFVRLESNRYSSNHKIIVRK